MKGKQHNLTMDLFYYRHNQNNVAPEIRFQKIAFCELTLVLKGTLIYKVNGETLHIDEGQGVFIKNDSYRQRDVGTEKSEYVSFNFTDETPSSLPVKIDRAVNSDTSLLIAYCDNRKNAIGSKCYDEMNFILGCIVKQLQAANEEKEHPLVEAVKKQIAQHLSEKLTLSMIAQNCNYSVSRLSSLFKQQTGNSITNYLIQARINKSKTLLAEGILSMEKIANKVGFSDTNYFIRTFKKQTFLTPLQYQKLFIDSSRKRKR